MKNGFVIGKKKKGKQSRVHADEAVFPSSLLNRCWHVSPKVRYVQP